MRQQAARSPNIHPTPCVSYCCVRRHVPQERVAPFLPFVDLVSASNAFPFFPAPQQPYGLSPASAEPFGLPLGLGDQCSPFVAGTTTIVQGFAVAATGTILSRFIRNLLTTRRALPPEEAQSPHYDCVVPQIIESLHPWPCAFKH